MVAPGDYSLSATTGADRAQEVGTTKVRVFGSDLNGVTINVVGAGSIRGRVVWDPSTPPRDPRTAKHVRLVSLPTTTQSKLLTVRGGDTWNADGTFEMVGLLGPHVLRVNPSIPDVYLKSVTLGGRDITDVPMDLNALNSATDLQVVVTLKTTDVSGTVVDERNAPVANYVAVIFPEDRSQWTAHSRYIVTGLPDAQGRFMIKGLPPGRYLAIAVDSIEIGQEEDPTLFPRLVPNAVRITLSDTEPTTVTLKRAVY